MTLCSVKCRQLLVTHSLHGMQKNFLRSSKGQPVELALSGAFHPPLPFPLTVIPRLPAMPLCLSLPLSTSHLGPTHILPASISVPPCSVFLFPRGERRRAGACVFLSKK